MLSLKKFLKSENIVATSVPERSGNLITLTAAWCETAGNAVFIMEGDLQVRVQWGTLVISDQCSRKITRVSPLSAAKYFALYLGSRKGDVTASPWDLANTFPTVRWSSLTKTEQRAWLNPELPGSRLKWARTSNRDEFLGLGQRDSDGRIVLHSEVRAPGSYEPPWTKLECRYAVLV